METPVAATLSATLPPAFDRPWKLATVDVIVPVLNEERALRGCVETLHSYLRDSLPLGWRITVVDNGSTDATWEIAQELTRSLDNVFARRLEVRGRGLALRTAWQESTADIVAYMDVDLSTGLDALFPLVAALASGHSELAIGTRLAHNSRTSRCLKREFVSRSYNALLRFGFGVKFTDAQCGFKAARADVIKPLLDKIEDNAWFFDTEMLLLAEHNGLRVHEVPVDWIEDMDSRVKVVKTAVDDLKGLARVTLAMSAGRCEVDLPKAAPAPTHPDAVLSRPRAVTLAKFASFATIGVFSALLYALAYLPLREVFSPAVANLVALVATGICNTEANRRFTFNRLGGNRVGMHLRAAVLFLANYSLTTLAVLGLHAAVPNVSTVGEVATVVATYCMLTLVRFIALDRWVFARTRK
ncbi:MAG: glycosyltransferase [Thermoactinospora sp.]|nr:glycosyltransferase [Thermoactinospora sp.]